MSELGLARVASLQQLATISLLRGDVAALRARLARTTLQLAAQELECEPHLDELRRLGEEACADSLTITKLRQDNLKAMGELRDALVRAERDNEALSSEIMRLRGAISVHREAVSPSDESGIPDNALWSVLETPSSRTHRPEAPADPESWTYFVRLPLFDPATHNGVRRYQVRITARVLLTGCGSVEVMAIAVAWTADPNREAPSELYLDHDMSKLNSAERISVYEECRKAERARLAALATPTATASPPAAPSDPISWALRPPLSGMSPSSIVNEPERQGK